MDTKAKIPQTMNEIARTFGRDIRRIGKYYLLALIGPLKRYVGFFLSRYLLAFLDILFFL